MLYIGADHGGYQLKEQLKKWLVKQKVEYIDVGAPALADGDDYPVYAEKVAQGVSVAPEKQLGLLMCRSGQGVAITANKMKGVRAAVVWNEEEAVASKNDDHANILCLPSDYVSFVKAKKIVKAWLDTSFSKEERHVRRVKMITKLEKH